MMARVPWTSYDDYPQTGNVPMLDIDLLLRVFHGKEVTMTDNEVRAELERIVYRCLKHGAVMKPVKIESIIKGGYVHLKYELEVCSECIKRRVPIMFTVEPEIAKNACKEE